MGQIFLGGLHNGWKTFCQRTQRWKEWVFGTGALWGTDSVCDTLLGFGSNRPSIHSLIAWLAFLFSNFLLLIVLKILTKASSIFCWWSLFCCYSESSLPLLVFIVNEYKRKLRLYNILLYSFWGEARWEKASHSFQYALAVAFGTNATQTVNYVALSRWKGCSVITV